MRFIGITGGVGAGKTEILKYIGQHYKCEIYLADEIGHKVKEPGTEGYHALVALMGDGILAPDGQIDKPAMAAKDFCRSDTVGTGECHHSSCGKKISGGSSGRGKE